MAENSALTYLVICCIIAVAQGMGIRDDTCRGRGDGDYPNPANCHTFWTCSNELAYLNHCEPTLQFDGRSRRCDMPEIAQCVPTAPPEEECDTDPRSCKDRPHGDLFPNPEDCRSFYQCSHGIAYLHQCPARLVFNPIIKVCDYDTSFCSEGLRSHCPSTPQPTTARPTTARPTTARPTTAAPTTARPTTARPTTARPTTARPTTARPTTARPTTKPTTKRPTTKPTTKRPTTTRKTTTTKKPGSGSGSSSSSSSSSESRELN